MVTARTIRRHALFAVLALVLAAAPAPSADRSVGVIMSGNLDFYQELNKAFIGALAKEGFDYRAVDTLLQMPSPDLMSWTNAARKLTVSGVSALVTYGAPATLAAIRETRSIPLVYAGVYDPAAVGATGRNVTGISARVSMTNALKHLKKLTPFARLAVVYNEQEPDSVRQMQELIQLEAQYHFRTVKLDARKTKDVRRLVFTGRADAVFVSTSAVANQELDTLVRNAHAAGIPTVSLLGGTAEHGVILSLAPNVKEQGEAAARMTARILRGERPAAIAPEEPQHVELTLNQKEAEAMGLKIPAELLADAARVIK